MHVRLWFGTATHLMRAPNHARRQLCTLWHHRFLDNQVSFRPGLITRMFNREYHIEQPNISHPVYNPKVSKLSLFLLPRFKKKNLNVERTIYENSL